MRLVIDRKRWIRGRYRGELGRGNCAMGFLRERSRPLFEAAASHRTDPLECPGGLGETDNLHAHIVCANDHMPDGLAREQKIADLFGKIGVDVEFI